MKLRNKKTGDIVEVLTDSIAVSVLMRGNDMTGYYTSLTELNAEWEDVPEEPKEYWLITWCGDIDKETDDGFEADKSCKEIGNYFKSKEEAEKAVEKLEARKRLKDNGFRFTGWTIDDGGRISICSNIDKEDIYDEDRRKMKPDLDLLFGGEDE